MTGPKQLFFGLCLFCGMYGLAEAQPKHSESRGELLYVQFCNTCHTSEIHWREQKLATDRNSLKAQVRRWQANIGLGWGEDEVTDVANYLNAVHYRFPAPDPKGFSQGKKPHQVSR